MPFLAKLDLDTNGDARRARRFLANRLDGLLVGNDRRFDVIIHNMSETGFLAEFSSELNPGDIVGLQLARIGFVEARVVRKRGLGHGCEFLVPIPADVLHDTMAASVSFTNSGDQQAEASPTDDHGDQDGYRKRASRERAGALVVMACLLLAVLVLGGALIWIFRT